MLKRADYYGSISDVERAVAVADEAVSNTPPDEPDRLAFVINLALALLGRHDQRPDPAAVGRAAGMLSKVARSVGENDPVRGRLLLAQASARYAQFMVRGSDDDLEAAIGFLTDATGQTVADEADRARVLNNLGVMLSERYHRTGHVQDLSGAISVLEQSIEITPVTSPERAAKLGHLAGVYVDSYARSGAITDLHRAGDLLTEAARATPADSKESADRDCDLGTVLLARYQHNGDLADLNEAVAMHSSAVGKARPADPGLALYLDQLGTSLRVRARRLADQSEAARAVLAHDHSVRQTGQGEPALPGGLNNLAGALRLSSGLSDDGTLIDALTEALAAYRRALAALPPGSPDRQAIQTNLGNCLLNVAQATSDDAALEEATALLAEAVRGSGPAEPELAGRLFNLGRGLRVRYDQTGSATDLTGAIDAYRRGCGLAEKASTEVQLTAGRSWGLWAIDRRSYAEAGEAFGLAADATDRLARLQVSRTAAQTWLAAAEDVAAAAAVANAASGQAETAVLHLERGRARLLSEALLRTRADLEALRKVKPDFASDYEAAAARVHALEQRAVRIRGGLPGRN